MAYQPKLDPGALLDGYIGVDAVKKGVVDGYITSNSPKPDNQKQSK